MRLKYRYESSSKISVLRKIFFILIFSDLDSICMLVFPVFSPEINPKFGSEIPITLIRFVGFSLSFRSSQTKYDCCLFFRSPY